MLFSTLCWWLISDWLVTWCKKIWLILTGRQNQGKRGGQEIPTWHFKSLKQIEIQSKERWKTSLLLFTEFLLRWSYHSSKLNSKFDRIRKRERGIKHKMNFLLNRNQKNNSFKDFALLSIVTEISFPDNLCRKWENEQMTARRSFSVLMAFPPISMSFGSQRSS